MQVTQKQFSTPQQTTDHHQTKTTWSTPSTKHVPPEAMASSVLMQKLFEAQNMVLAHAASSSSNFLPQIAMEVLQSRHFQSAETSVLRIPVTGKGLGGGKNEDAKERAKQFVKLGQEIASHSIAIEILFNKQNELEDRLNDLEPGSSDYQGFIAAAKSCNKQIRDFEQKIDHAREQINKLSQGESSNNN